MEVQNDEVIQAVFTATDEAKEQALAILQGLESPPVLSGVEGPGSPDAAGPLLLTMGQSAELLGVSRATLWRMLRAGRLEKVELYPGSYRLRRSDILDLVKGGRHAN